MAAPEARAYGMMHQALMLGFVAFAVLLGFAFGALWFSTDRKRIRQLFLLVAVAAIALAVIEQR